MNAIMNIMNEFISRADAEYDNTIGGVCAPENRWKSYLEPTQHQLWIDAEIEDETEYETCEECGKPFNHPILRNSELCDCVYEDDGRIIPLQEWATTHSEIDAEIEDETEPDIILQDCYGGQLKIYLCWVLGQETPKLWRTQYDDEPMGELRPEEELEAFCIFIEEKWSWEKMEKYYDVVKGEATFYDCILDEYFTRQFEWEEEHLNI